MKRVAAALLLALWMPIVGAAAAIARFGDLPVGGPGSPPLDLPLLYLAGLPGAACLLLAWPPASRRDRLRLPMAIAAAIVLGGLLATVGSQLGPLGVLASGVIATAPLIGPAAGRLRRSRSS